MNIFSELLEANNLVEFENDAFFLGFFGGYVSEQDLLIGDKVQYEGNVYRVTQKTKVDSTTTNYYEYELKKLYDIDALYQQALKLGNLYEDFFSSLKVDKVDLGRDGYKFYYLNGIDVSGTLTQKPAKACDSIVEFKKQFI